MWAAEGCGYLWSLVLWISIQLEDSTGVCSSDSFVLTRTVLIPPSPSLSLSHTHTRTRTRSLTLHTLLPHTQSSRSRPCPRPRLRAPQIANGISSTGAPPDAKAVFGSFIRRLKGMMDGTSAGSPAGAASLSRLEAMRLGMRGCGIFSGAIVVFMGEDALKVRVGTVG